jgi:hypothetical protein
LVSLRSGFRHNNSHFVGSILGSVWPLLSDFHVQIAAQ